MAMPKTWPLQRKDKKYITVGKGTQKQELSISLLVALRDMLKVLATKAEAKKLLKEGNVIVNGRIVKDIKVAIGLFDRLHIKKLEQYYSIYLTEKGKLSLIEINEKKSEKKPCKIIGKKVLAKNKLQINCNDGRNFILEHVKSSLKVGDSLIVELKTNKIAEHLPLAKGAFVMIIAGRNLGKHGKIETIDGDIAAVHLKHTKISVPKWNLFVLEEKEFEK